MSGRQIDSLLLNLHKRSGRPSEDFTTEAFAYLVRYLLRHEKIAAARMLALLTPEGKQFPEEAIERDEVSVTTQVSTARGQPDIEIRAPGVLVFVEVKLEAEEGKRQLSRYRQVLEDDVDASHKWLVFLTARHTESSEKPDVSLKWHQVGSLLQTEQATEAWSVPTTAFLVDEFLQFMEGIGLTMRQISWSLPDGVRALCDFRNMLRRAIEGKLQRIGLSPGWGWMGYNYDGGWVGILFDSPTVLHFEVELPSGDHKELTDCMGGTIGTLRYPNKPVWYCSEDLASEQVHFFARSQASQIQVLEGFVAKGMAGLGALYPKYQKESDLDI